MWEVQEDKDLTLDRRFRIGDIVRHFKGNYYKIVGFAHDSETKESVVIYKALYSPYGLWVRPQAMFESEVDREKYPEAVQKFRFERCFNEEELKVPIK